jgi:hypothetical protein|tara:strand:- start:960 stop:1259 length:300 start_codon:yes stop_codon:yes gene_type:complete
MKIYKVRNKDTGLYSAGGTHPSFTSTGKTYSSTGTVRSHIRQFSSMVERLEEYRSRFQKNLRSYDNHKLKYAQDFLNSVEIVEFDVTEVGILSFVKEQS